MFVYLKIYFISLSATDCGDWKSQARVRTGVLLLTPQRREFSCVFNIVISTLSDSHSSHTWELCHCALLICDPEDYPVIVVHSIDEERLVWTYVTHNHYMMIILIWITGFAFIFSCSFYLDCTLQESHFRMDYKALLICDADDCPVLRLNDHTDHTDTSCLDWIWVWR